MTVSISESPAALYSLTFIVGACVGSFLNVLAIRLLAEKNVLKPPSHCLDCDHKLGAFELIPVASYFLLGGKCKHCRRKISWQYPVVELFTALWFMLVVWKFGLTPEGFGMLYFSSVLIAVSVTDFREKLIPHEITYPSILFGILFSGLVRNDLIGTMAGIGGSYILFDFIAFYGLKLYPYLHPEVKEPQEVQATDDDEDTVIDSALGVGPEPETEEFEVMGGGDAVLAALVSAWLGWERLVITVMLGFIFGAALGGMYLVGEMKKAGILGHCIKRGLIGFAIFSAIGAAMFLGLAHLSNQSLWQAQWFVAIGIFAFSGGFVGFIWAGKRVSRPFPFGPALALAAAVSMFFDPHSIFPSERF
ncbi:MAG: prepilin peptidase [Candidatus Melainabacteria bacterium]|nr:prepilin peptidase [Candidatus Melainabacteria bacterium]